MLPVAFTSVLCIHVIQDVSNAYKPWCWRERIC